MAVTQRTESRTSTAKAGTHLGDAVGLSDEQLIEMYRMVALARAIDLVLTDSVERKALVERGRQRVLTHFAWPVVAAQTSHLFRAALAHRQTVVPSVQAVRT